MDREGILGKGEFFEKKERFIAHIAGCNCTMVAPPRGDHSVVIKDDDESSGDIPGGDFMVVRRDSFYALADVCLNRSG